MKAEIKRDSMIVIVVGGGLWSAGVLFMSSSTETGQQDLVTNTMFKYLPGLEA